MPAGGVSDTVAASLELNTRHILRALSEAKLTSGDEHALQDTIETMLDEIDSVLIEKIRTGEPITVTVDGKQKTIPPDEYIDGRFQFMCKVIRAFKPEPSYLQDLFLEVTEDYVEAQHAPVPKTYSYRVEALLQALRKLKLIYAHMKTRYEWKRGQFQDYLMRLIAHLSSRGLEVLEHGLGDKIFSPDNFEAFAKKYLRHGELSSGSKRRDDPS